MHGKTHMVAAKARAALRRRWVRVALALLVLVAGISGTFWTAHHVADSVTITITYYGAPPGTPPAEAANWTGKETLVTVYTVTINDAAKARAIQSLLDHTQMISPFVSYECIAARPPYYFDFHFSYLGLPVQRIHGGPSGCHVLSLTTLGITLPLRHSWPRDNVWRQVVQLVGMPDFGGLSQQP